MSNTNIDEGQLYINGKAIETSSGWRFDVTDPSTGTVIGTVDRSPGA
jgi:acyl-CoA reductase-like NAD-dependent aldehyde dehydrogenase